MNLIKIPDFLIEEEKKETESLINSRITFPPCLFQNPFSCNQILNDPIFSNPNLSSDLSDLEDKEDKDKDENDCDFRQTSSCGWEQDKPITCGSSIVGCQNQAMSCSWLGMEPTEPEEEEEDDCGRCETCQRCLGCTGYCESNCTSYCEDNCTAHCERNCTIYCEDNCTTHCERNCTIYCEDNCTTHCESNCTTHCENNCTVHCESNCTSYCENNCTVHCESNCTVHCESNCTTHCESNCTTHCESNCTTHCESNCTTHCESNCMTHCERNCTTHCENNCTTHCENNCTHICEAGCQDCQTPCQLSSQHVHIWKTFYEQIANNNTHHRVYTKCIDTSCNLIIDDKKEVHNFDTTDYYHDGWAVQKCSTCGYIKRIRQIVNFEWSYAKGSDNLDVLITAEEWNRFLELLTYKLRSANKESSINHLKAVQKSSLITAEKFNGVIDKLKLIKATSVPNKVAPGALVLNHTHLNALKDSLNSARNLR